MTDRTATDATASPAVPASTAPVRVVIVGGGASGVLVAARCFDADAARSSHITLVDPSGRLASGVAYGTDDPEHLLNVRASGMSAHPSDPDELVDWLVGRGVDPAQARDTFLPRREYRTYLRDHLEASWRRAPGGTFEHLTDRVTAIDLDPTDRTARVRLTSGATLVADRVVLAIGNAAPAIPPPLAGLEGHPGWVPDPWARGALRSLRAARDILLVGSGLTMVDVAITLARDSVASGPARLTAISRTGLLPQAHVPVQPVRPIDAVRLDRDSADVVAFRDRIRARVVDGIGREYDDEDWREVIDAIRPFANALWRRFDPAQREVFLAELQREWDVHRHRMSPTTAARLAALVDAGRLVTSSGRLLDAVTVGRRIVVQVQQGDGVEEISADAVVNCTGPGRGWTPPPNPVVSHLLVNGLARRGAHDLGLDCTEDGSLVDEAGAPVPEILVIGPPRKGAVFETTAVPELRSQALHLADRIVAGF